MTEHCMIDGQRCSKCCEVLTININKNFREWSKYVRRYGYPDDFNHENKVHHMLRKVSKRRAKIINPGLVKKVGNAQSYFTCKNYTGSGCSVYENRPRICSGYPYYGLTKEDFLKTENVGLYRDDCTYFIELK